MVKKKRIKMKQPLVSIITPMFNSASFIADCIKSIQSQSYKNWELYLIDDASTDQTLQIVKPFIESDSRIKLITNAVNSGAAVARNLGISYASGDFIAFLDADDLWLPNKLEIQVSVLLNSQCAVCFSSYYQINEPGTKKVALINALPKLTYSKLLKSNYIGNLTGIYSVKSLGKITSLNLRKRQDWLLWLQALKVSKHPAIGVLEPLAHYRVRSQSISANKLGLVKYNYWVYKKGLNFTTLRSVWRTTVFLIEHVFIKTRFIKKLD